MDIDNLSYKTAVDLSIVKWRMIIQNEGNYDCIPSHPILSKLHSYCGLCGFQSQKLKTSISVFCSIKSTTVPSRCKTCAIRGKDNGLTCYHDDSVFNKHITLIHKEWKIDEIPYSITEKIKAARGVLAAVLELKKDIIFLELKG